MSATDIVILAILILPALVGVIYGFLNILFSVIAWVLALGISMKFGDSFSPLLRNYIDTPLVRDVLAFIVLFIVSLMIFTALGYFIVKLLGRSGLTAMDRILGFLFGTALGCVIVVVSVFLAGFTSLPELDWWRESMIIEPFQRTALWAGQFLPDNVTEYHRYPATAPPANQ
ncbi:MAG: CvpA family protein [Gammaproteobacteria bacterium]